MAQEMRSEEKTLRATVQEKLAVAGGTGTLTGIGLSLLPHMGVGGLFFGGVASIVAWRHGDDLAHAGHVVFDATTSTIEWFRSRKEANSRAPRVPARPKEDGRSSLPQRFDEDDALPDVSFDVHGVDDLPRLPAGDDVFSFSQILDLFNPTADRIFLARTSDGTDLYCHARDLCHVALAGFTGGGKSSIMRMLMLQLCKARMKVLLLNPHYTRYDIESIGPDGKPCPEDWTPFEPYLVHPPMECRKYSVIEHYLKNIAKDLIPKRLEKRAHSQPVGQPYFVVIDELPSIIREIKAAPDYMRIILEEGRKVGVFLISAAQDFLVKTISPTGGGGSIRECYRTAYYVGGDPTTGKVLLDMPPSLIPEDELGKGVVMLRGKPSKKAAKVYVPYVDNASIYRLLGPSTYQASRPVPSLGIDLEQADLSDLKRQTDQDLKEIERARPFRSETTPETMGHLKQPVERDAASETGEGFQMDGPETTLSSSETHLKQPEEPSETAPKTPDRVKTYEQAHAYFREDVDAVIAVIMKFNTRRRLFDREDIKAALGWNNYKQPIIKVVCDKFRVAMPNIQK